MNLDALIFDVDGTLADTEETHRTAWNLAFHDHSLDWFWSKPHYARLLKTAGGKERLAAYIDSLTLPPSEHAAFIARVSSIHKTETEHYARMVLSGGVPLREGVARLMDEAVGSSVKLAIASATNPHNVQALLNRHWGADALARFSVIGAGDQVPRKKPAPDIYFWVLDQLKASPERCVAIEDSSNGLIAAKLAGLFTIVTPSDWTIDENFSAADIVLPFLGSDLDLAEIDRRLNGARMTDRSSEHSS